MKKINPLHVGGAILILAAAWWWFGHYNKQWTTDEFVELMGEFNHESITEQKLTLLTEPIAPRISPLREDGCTVITDPETYIEYRKAYEVDELCKECRGFNFANKAIYGMHVEEIGYKNTSEGFSKFLFRDDEQKKIIYLVVSDAYRLSNLDSVNVAVAAYLFNDYNWLVQGPQVPEGYTVECRAAVTSN